MTIVFETELEFEDAVMKVLKQRLTSEIFVSVDGYYNPPKVTVELDISDSDEDGFGLLTRTEAEGN